MGFQTLSHKLSELLARTMDGRIQLPDFQRSYVWDDERVRQLLVSIAQGHPLGVLLLLETGNEKIHFESKPLEGVKVGAGVQPDNLVLDGQQRLTSLTQALTGNGIVQISGARPRRYFIDVQQAVAVVQERGEEELDLSGAIESFPADGVRRTNFNRDIVLDVSTTALQQEHGWFPFNLVFTDEATNWLFDYPDSAAAKTFLNAVLSPMKSYTIPAIELDKQTTTDAVTTVFEKVNQGGVKLTVFELLTAKFAGDRKYHAAHGHAFRLRDDWDKLSERFAEHLVLKSFERDDFLQVITLLASNSRSTATTARKEDVLKLGLEEYQQWSEVAADAVVKASHFLEEQSIHAAGDVPYPKQIVPLAAIIALLGKTAVTHGARRLLRQWYWCGVLGELYGGAIGTRFVRDVEEVPTWVRNDGSGEPPVTVAGAYFQESRLSTMRTRNSAAYKGVQALLMAGGATDWQDHQQISRAHYLELAIDIHHIFPQKWCNEHDVYWGDRDSIINKTPIGASTNRMLQGDAPSVYLPRLRARARISDDELDAVIAAHCIDTDALRADDFEVFFAARRTALCELIAAAMSKPVSRDVPEQGAGEVFADPLSEEPEPAEETTPGD